MRADFQEAIEAGDETFRETKKRLKKNPGVDTCAALCRRVNGVVEGKFSRLQKDGAGISCVAGCNFCCYLRVSVQPHEAIALFYHLRTIMPKATAAQVEQKILENAARVDAMTVDEHYATNLQCAFLVDGLCSAYAVRPSACAGYHSMSRAHCEQSYQNPADFGDPQTGKPTLFELQAFTEAQQQATQAGVQAAGFVADRIELHQALREIIQDPQVMQRWRRGGPLVKRTA